TRRRAHPGRGHVPARDARVRAHAAAGVHRAEHPRRDRPARPGPCRGQSLTTLTPESSVLSPGLQPEPLLSELSRPGAPGHQLPALDVPDVDDLGGQVLRPQLSLPEVGELDVVRHFTHLAQRNFSIDAVFYPLGSCTMKYNPRVNEDVARLPGIAHIHPLQPDETVQGALRIMFELQQLLVAITGFSAATLHPAAGAQG